MTSLQHFSTPNAPGNLAAYSQAVIVGNTIYVSGCIGLNTKLEFTSENIEGQTRQVSTSFCSSIPFFESYQI